MIRRYISREAEGRIGQKPIRVIFFGDIIEDKREILTYLNENDVKFLPGCFQQGLLQRSARDAPYSDAGASAVVKLSCQPDWVEFDANEELIKRLGEQGFNGMLAESPGVHVA